jgi:hypothetical protein
MSKRQAVPELRGGRVGNGDILSALLSSALAVQRSGGGRAEDPMSTRLPAEAYRPCATIDGIPDRGGIPADPRKWLVTKLNIQCSSEINLVSRKLPV